MGKECLIIKNIMFYSIQLLRIRLVLAARFVQFRNELDRENTILILSCQI